MQNLSKSYYQTQAAEPAGQIKVWDPLVRIFHWSLVVLFFTAYISEDDLQTVHFYAGYGVAFLITFRLLWGLIGSRYARFSNFVTSYAELKAYLKSLLSLRVKHYTGHNPAGGWMVVLLLVTLTLLSVSGLLLAAAEGEGPLASWYVAGHWLMSESVMEPLHEFAANFMISLIVIHIAGVLFSSVLHKENLIRAMITGNKKH
ncbi:cytochrome b/b6 domain-containing protein [Aliamphritea spongicola]|uniref:cytochrome b/b6 domain-containing protein n=1 Tax=Aliamphritea spongicola TaxID=707589 RepID=UPI00196A21CC|nr:cytochrome b/b6 domain-containing protein [Aliamphritea spongicola]MBN3560813.1 cytochrome b/b6 domain-containing protein [Aliamphritea spongicola]